jgi:hypothetical protein
MNRGRGDLCRSATDAWRKPNCRNPQARKWIETSGLRIAHPMRLDLRLPIQCCRLKGTIGGRGIGYHGFFKRNGTREFDNSGNSSVAGGDFERGGGLGVGQAANSARGRGLPVSGQYRFSASMRIGGHELRPLALTTEENPETVSLIFSARAYDDVQGR